MTQYSGQSCFHTGMIVVQPLCISFAFCMFMNGIKSYFTLAVIALQRLSLNVPSDKMKCSHHFYITSGLLTCSSLQQFYNIVILCYYLFLLGHMQLDLHKCVAAQTVRACVVLNSGTSVPLVLLRVPLLFMLSPIVLPGLIFLYCVCVCVHTCACWCVSACVCIACIQTPHPSHPSLPKNRSNPLGLKKEIPALCPGLFLLGVCQLCATTL